MATDQPELVVLDPDHPGFRDPVYRARRNAIADIARRHTPGTRVEHAVYTPEEHALWKVIRAKLEPVHQAHAPEFYLKVLPSFDAFRTRIPEMAEVNDAMTEKTGWSFIPAGGLVLAEDFLRGLADRRFYATQYLRHPSRPLYTPEPDIVHEFMGHAVAFLDQRIARLNQLFGKAMHRVAVERTEALIRLYWYTMEFGVVREGDKLKALGAGLLSSFGELEQFAAGPTLQPMNMDVIAKTPFDPTQYQSTLFVADSIDAFETSLTRALESF